MQDTDQTPAQLRTSRRARLFDLYRQEAMPSEDPHRPNPTDVPLTEGEAARLQGVAITSLSRGTPWRQRIFRLNRRGSHPV
ncbi:hypothetical protein SAMN04488078_101483 [Antarctobacter heliothermus]|uniref:Uncharacterized protein n=1 Tax=Antarctobacter heliothermus TaxID=74033 RepID=A0A239EDF3_9RHOB|nr:hypothetical protein SAMN04488078_101483 [Antarctobacter heliothermus]